jgi:hypothetical protein
MTRRYVDDNGVRLASGKKSFMLMEFQAAAAIIENFNSIWMPFVVHLHHHHSVAPPLTANVARSSLAYQHHHIILKFPSRKATRKKFSYLNFSLSSSTLSWWGWRERREKKITN